MRESPNRNREDGEKHTKGGERKAGKKKRVLTCFFGHVPSLSLGGRLEAHLLNGCFNLAAQVVL